MNASATIRRARREAGLSLRQLARRAGTSHATISAYESGSKCPTADTLLRIVEAAGFALDVDLHRRHRGGDPATDSEQPAELDRGDELIAVLELAAAFPARHDDELRYPVFPAA